MKKRLLLTSFLAWIATFTAVAQPALEVAYSAKLQSESRPLPHYWRSTGFSPSDLLDYPDMEMTLNYLKASRAIEFIRPHYLLDHVKVSSFGTEKQAYDWSALDRKLDKIVDNDIRLIFEIMGRPAERKVDFSDEKDLHAWKKLVRDMAQHLIGRYGEDVVSSWWFETTNEPDIWHFWSDGYIKFLNYYDACSEGLKEANPKLMFGGPGSVKDENVFLKLLLEHCAWGKNYFTGETGVRIDFITIHRKDHPHQMVEQELKTWRYVEHDYPQFRELPVGNDEADPIAGWGIPYYWRTGPWYAAFIAQSVDLHNRLILDSVGLNYRLLSNDHGFLGSWGKRTQLARFLPGDNDQDTRGASRTGGGRAVSPEEDERTPVERFYLIKQPSLTVMNLMELLGHQRYEVKGIDGHQLPNLGAIVTTRDKGDVAIMAYNKPEIDLRALNWKPAMEAPEAHRKALSNQGATIELNLQGLEDGEYKLVHYRIDDEHTNPYRAWQQMGSPENPSTEQYLKMAEAMEPQAIEIRDVNIKGRRFAQDIAFPASGVSFLLLARQGEAPGQVQGLEYRQYKGLNGEDMAMLLWESGATDHVLSYEVYAKAPGEEAFRKANPANLIAEGFAHPSEEAKGYQYRVRAVDYWNRKGPFSETITINE